MGAEGAANVIFRKEIKESEDPVAKRKEVIENSFGFISKFIADCFKSELFSLKNI